MVPLTLALSLATWAAFILRRVQLRRAGKAATAAPEVVVPRWMWPAAHVVALLVAWPLIAAAPAFLRAGSILPGDAPAFARVAATVAERGMPHGWIDVYAGGFPGAMHYQPLPVALIAALIKLGAPAVTATNLAGIAAVLLLPQALLAALRWAGVRPLAALAGAIALTLTSPERPLVGGFDVAVTQGILAQAIAMPVLVLAGGAVLGPRARWSLPIFAWLTAAAHPQLLVTALGLGVVGFAVAGPRRHRDEVLAFVLFGVVAGVSLVALYGLGLASFRIPFGFPQLQGWRLMGFHPVRFDEFVIEGGLLDHDRAAVLTAAWTASLVALLARADRGAPRALIAISMLALLLPFSGYFFADSRVLRALVQAVTPTRVVAFAPIAAALSIALAADGAVPFIMRTRVGWLAAAVVLGLFVATATPIVRSRLTTRAQLEDAPACGGFTPAGWDTSAIMAWLRPLRGGRLFIDRGSFHSICPAMRGAHLASGAPIAEHSGGPGTQVGINIAAVEILDLTGASGAARAEALGIRWVLHTTARPPGPPEAWRVREQRDSVTLSERIGGGDLWGSACITETWSGSNAALRSALLDDFAAKGSSIADPARVVALVVDRGPLTVRRVEAACDASSARVEPIASEPGAHQADVELPSGAVAVLRVTAHGSWNVRIDGGAPLTLDGGGLSMIAPGYLAIPVPPGRHRIEAVVRLPRAYPIACLLSAALAIALAAHLRRRHRDRAIVAPA